MRLFDLKNKYSNTFDKILLDVPCSGEGMFRKDHHLIDSWLDKNNDYYAKIQKNIIDSAVKMLKDGGIIAYSTCTFDKKEDEDIIQYALDKYNNLEVLPINTFSGFKKGDNNLGVKLFPHLIKGEGQFVCLIKKNGQSNKKTFNPNNNLELPFLNLINKELNEGTFKIINDNLYYAKDFDTNNIRVLRSGLLLGSFKNNHFKPSNALAYNLKNNEFKNVINLDETNALKYLKGETISYDSFIDDYALICYKGYSLGFGKVKDKQIKNLIDKGWIMK